MTNVAEKWGDCLPAATELLFPFATKGSRDVPPPPNPSLSSPLLACGGVAISLGRISTIGTPSPPPLLACGGVAMSLGRMLSRFFSSFTASSIAPRSPARDCRDSRLRRSEATSTAASTGPTDTWRERGQAQMRLKKITRGALPPRPPHHGCLQARHLAECPHTPPLALPDPTMGACRRGILLSAVSVLSAPSAASCPCNLAMTTWYREGGREGVECPQCCLLSLQPRHDHLVQGRGEGRC